MLTDTRLEERLRDTCHAVIPRLLDHDDHLGRGEVAQKSPSRRLFRPTSIAAALALIAGTVAAITVLIPRDAEAPAQANEQPSCAADGCGPFDALPVTPGSTDFYVGAAALGEPRIDLGWFDHLVRCAELDVTRSACARIEGIAGISLVHYPPPDGVTLDTIGRSESSYEISIGTTFTTTDPFTYARQWPPDGTATMADVMVRGQPGVRFTSDLGTPAVVWQERPGVLVWVSVPPERADDLLNIAEGVRPQPGPATIPDQVVVGDARWGAWNNNAAGIVVGRVGTTECFGWRAVTSCEQTIGARTHVDNIDRDGTVASAVAGSTPPEVASVVLTLDDGTVGVAEPAAFADYESRFYQWAVAGRTIRQVSWLNEQQQTLASFDVTDESLNTDTYPFAYGVVIVDASGIPDLATRLSHYLTGNGVAVSAVLPSTRVFEQTMLHPMGGDSTVAQMVDTLLDFPGYDEFSPALVSEPLPGGTTVVITLGADGGPPRFVTRWTRNQM